MRVITDHRTPNRSRIDAKRPPETNLVTSSRTVAPWSMVLDATPPNPCAEGGLVAAECPGRIAEREHGGQACPAVGDTSGRVLAVAPMGCSGVLVTTTFCREPADPAR